MIGDSRDAPGFEAEPFDPPLEGTRPPHLIDYYDDDRFPAGAVGEFLWKELDSGGGAVVLATPEHNAAIRGCLAAHGAALGSLERADRLVFRDAQATLREVMRWSLPCGACFRALAGALVDRAAAAAPSGRVRAVSELAALVADEGNLRASEALGRLWSEILAGRPCRLYCAHPLAVPAPTAEGPSSPADRRDAARPPRPRVLVVDDNRDAADMLAVALQQAGYEVEVAYDGPGALARAAESPPQCAVVDIGLPVMDGWELAGRLRAGRPPGALRLVAVTGYGQDSDRERSRRAGFDAHLVKPLELEVILQELESQRGAGAAAR